MATVSVSLDPSAMRTKVLERKKAEAVGIRLEDAEVVVCGGRGIGGAEGFQTLDELASVLGGAVGVTRAVCDMGWRPVSEQIGLTGKVVSPTLYFAIALSGASQHMAGCSGAKNIVAINKDAEANVFKSARFGIVGDYRQVMPALLEAVKKLTELAVAALRRYRERGSAAGVPSLLAAVGGQPLLPTWAQLPLAVETGRRRVEHFFPLC